MRKDIPMMSPIQCAQFERILEEQPDGPLSAGAAEPLEGCIDCRVLWSDMGAIRAAGLEGGKEEVEAPEYLWSSLRRQLESEGLIRERPTQRGWFSAWFGAAPRWTLAGASVSLLLIGAMVATYQVNQPDVAGVLPLRLSVSAV